MPGWGWANFLVPMVFGRVYSLGVFFQHFQSWTSSYYLGTGALLLALLGVWTVRQTRVWLLAAAAGAALVMAFGDQTVLYRWLGRLVPQLSLMTNPVKFVTVLIFAVPLLAAYGAAAWQKGTGLAAKAVEGRLIFVTGILLMLIAGILLWAQLFPFPMDQFPATLRNGIGRAVFLSGTAILLWVWRRIPQPKLQRVLALALLAVCWLDVLTHEPMQNPTAPSWIYQPGLAREKLAMKPQPALGASRVMITPAADSKLTGFIVTSQKDNFLVKRLGYFANCNLLDDVPKVNGFFSLYPRECGELNSVLYGQPWENYPRLNDFMSVSQITAPDKSFDWVARDSFLPMVTTGQKPLFLNDSDALGGITSSNFNGSKIVILPPEMKPLVSVTNRTRAQVVSTKFTAQRVDVELEAAETSLVVLSQTYYHFWRASVDGRPVRLLRANYAFQAVEVPAGRHHLRVAYRDRTFYAGSLISGLALIGGALSCRKRGKQGALNDCAGPGGPA